MDCSNDLREMGQNQMCIVSSGVKSILDIKNTLEYLETEGISFYGYKTNDFPAFLNRKSGYQCESIDSVEKISQLVRMQFDYLNINKCLLITNPIEEKYSINDEIFNNASKKASLLAKEKNISGKEITPFMLKTI